MVAMMLNILSFLVLVQIPITLGNSNPEYTLCNLTFCDRIREVPSFNFTKSNSVMAGYHYHKKESKYDFKNIYSDCILDFNWIKNPTIKQYYPTEHSNHNMCNMNCHVKKKQIQRAIDKEYGLGR